MREIRDEAGVEWVVYEVQRAPGLPSSKPDLPEHLRNGWLCFESAIEKRRLTPTPSGWQDLPPQELRKLLGGATLVKRVPQNVS